MPADVLASLGSDEEPTVQATGEEFAVPSEEELTDAQASAQLKELFTSYQDLKKRRPRFPAEAVVIPALIFRPAALDTMVANTVGEFHAWTNRMKNLLGIIHTLGVEHPSASMAIIGKSSGRRVQVNGSKLYEALARTEKEILGGQLGG